MKKRKRLINALIIVCIIGIVFSGYHIVVWKINVDKNTSIKENVKKYVKVTATNKYDIDFKKLLSENPDTVGYLKVNNTNIDYIVVRGNDNSYYLKHNFNKEYNIAGWIFADYRNKLDETDKNIIIYGHDTKDGSMFGSLINVLDEKWYTNSSNLEIDLVTRKDEYKYRVFSTYMIPVDDYYLKTDFKDNSEFSSFLNNISKRSQYNYGVDLNEDDSILTLSSCVGDGSKRIVLHAKLIKKVK